jgi:nicotinamide-nucleotide amidase
MPDYQLQPLVEALVDHLRNRSETIAFAESCTGGMLSAALTDLPGVSDVFLGSVVAYAYSIKESELGVSGTVLRTLGAVSTPVARQMAVGLRRKFSSTWSASITGIAGPGGGTAQKPVGTVCFGICGPGVDVVDQQVFSGSRQQVREASVEHALRLLLSEMGADGPQA